MNAINQLLSTLSAKPVPSGEVNGIMLEDFSQRTLAVVREAARGVLNSDNTGKLHNSLAVMRQLNPQLSGENQVYFGLLYRVCELASEQVSPAASS